MSGEAFSHEVIRASAGSGKTYQLTQRYVGLLNAGVEPAAMLASTFTRKAAAEILNRVLQKLAEDAERAKLSPPRQDCEPDAISLLRAILRGLHRMRIGTLDSFFIAVAGAFGLELGLPAGWSICEEVDDAALRQEALERLLEQQPEEIGKLFTLLSKGESKRAVHAELNDVIEKHYETFCDSERAAWESLQVPPMPPAAECSACLEKVRSFDFSRCGHKNYGKAQASDVAKFERRDWIAFLGAGMAAVVAAGDTTYYNKRIPPEAVTLYATLIQQARSAIVQRLAEQTRATWAFLDGFHRELWSLKRSTGRLRFGDVTLALAQPLQRQELPEDALGFRLDGALDHLLLDEFQDTSLPQWRVLRTLARRIVESDKTARRSFFCVGDVKQSIYGWRGGMPQILQTIQDTLGALCGRELLESRRSAQPIIDVVNKTFGELPADQLGDRCAAGLREWGSRFQKHGTVMTDLAGYVCLHAGPRKEDGQYVADQRVGHCKYVAEKVQELWPKVSGCSVGVLCRRNETVARMIYELHQLEVPASEEGGNPLTDSPAVELLLSLFTLVDHPGHSVARFHLVNSPLNQHLESIVGPANTWSRELRRELFTKGYGEFTYYWAQQFAPACARRDLSRLQQLVETAYAYQARSTLRADDFVAWIRQQKVPDPSSANVRVMTIHGAKGLQFDVVVLPELDVTLTGRPPAFVVSREQKSLEVKLVCRYADESVQALLGADAMAAFEQDCQARVEESLSMLYVAMTRAVHAMYLYIPGPRDGRSNRKDAWYNLLRSQLSANGDQTEKTTLFEHGDREWYEDIPREAATPVTPEAVQPARLRFAPAADRRRGLETIAPSRREGGGRVEVAKLFKPSEGTGMAAGTLYHAWFELIEWLDEGLPNKDALVARAAKLRAELPLSVWREMDELLATFCAWLHDRQISDVLRRSAYESPAGKHFPCALRAVWTKELQPQRVERERRFLVPDGDKLWNGSLDRVVWLADGQRIVAADVLDFKTDGLEPGNAQAVEERTKHYRPQLEAYRMAVSRLSGLPVANIATRLVFTFAGQVVDVR